MTKSKNVRVSPHYLLLLVGLVIWFSSPPAGLPLEGWKLLAIFATTIVALIMNILPMGAVSIIALSICIVTKTLSLSEAISGFNSKILWLVILAIMIARGFIKTGLGTRLAYYFVVLLGKSTIGLSYGLIATEVLLAPLIPSNTARGAGIIYPIVLALNKEYRSLPKDKSAKRIGAYLISLCFHTNIITSSMFLTAMASNPLIVELAAKAGVTISWSLWAKALFLPGLACLLALPWLLAIISPPEIRHTPQAPEFAAKKLKAMGKLKSSELIMMATFVFLLVLWIFGSSLKIDATSAAMLGLALLLLTGVLNWQDVLEEKSAWNTFIWMGTLLTLSGYLADFGVISWFSGQAQVLISNLPSLVAVVLVFATYFYSHYFFASITARVSAMFSAFLVLGVSSGLALSVTAYTLAGFSSLCACLTHYSTGSAPVYYGANYVKLKDWWRIGAILGFAYIVIWSVTASIWWRAVGII